MRLRPAWDLARGLTARYRDADLGINAAAVAYNAFLALVPLGLALLGFAAFVGASDAALDRVRATLASVAPQEVTGFVVDLLVESEQRLGGQQGWLIAGSIVLALFLGSRAVVALQKALARVENGVERRPVVQMRLVGVALTLGGGVALMVTSLLLLAGRRMMAFLVELTGMGFLDDLWVWLRVPVAAAGLFVFLLAVYRWGPPRPLPKPWLASLVGTAGALGASLLFGLYLAVAPGMGATFGVLGAVAVALVWLYLGAFAILLGAMVVASTLEWRSARRGDAP